MKHLIKFLFSILCVSTSLAQTMDSGAFGSGSGYSDAEAFWETPKRLQPPLMTTPEKKLLQLSPTLTDSYKNFVQQKDSGVIRLLPREMSDQKKSRAGGAYYTFVRQLYGNFNGADIRFEKNNFITGGDGANLGFMTNLGDRSLDTISITTDGVEHLANLSAPKKEKEARSMYAKFQTGYVAHEQLYKASLPLASNSTYVVRSIRYKKHDSLVAFRVVQQDANGGVVILWKLLKEYKFPSL